jgi:predicted ATP-grasp superfamily ATP-dependent carboligase
MHASRDIVAAYQELSRGSLKLRDYLAGLRKPMAFASFALDDPLPAIVELPAVAWYHFAKGREQSSDIHRAEKHADILPAGR